MRNARALLASIGTSAVLVAAAAISLLSLSAVFAVVGFSGSDRADARSALVLDDVAASGPDSSPSVKTVVLKAPTRPSSPRPGAGTTRQPATQDGSSGHATVSTTAGAATLDGGGSQDGGAPNPPPPSRPAGGESKKKSLGDGVRELGDGVSSTVEQLGDGLGEATQPLGPPVSEAVQNVLNLVAALLKGTTTTLGNALGTTP